MADTTEKTISDELRAAAATLRETADSAPAGPWQVDGPWWWAGKPATCSSVLTTGHDREAVAVIAPEYNRHPQVEGAATWMALANPLLAEPLVSWLDYEADEIEANGGLVLSESGEHALNVARLVNGGMP